MYVEDVRSISRSTSLKLLWITLATVELNRFRIRFLNDAYGAEDNATPMAIFCSSLVIATAATGLVQRPLVTITATAEAYGRLEDEQPGAGRASSAATAPLPVGAEFTASLLSQVLPTFAAPDFLKKAHGFMARTAENTEVT